MQIQLPKGAMQIIHRLNDAGFEAFVVGGCVRDCVMGKTPTDWDITTPALPQQIRKVFNEAKKIEFGERHGTIAVKADEHYYEITTYRIDGTYSDGRRPDTVSFTPNLQDDLRRRDFTVNAMAFSPSAGLIDPFGGVADIKNRMMRCVGEPTERFAEDYLRILRAYRFSATLNFSLETQTKKAALAGLSNLEKIARERIGAEISKLLCAENADLIIAFLDDTAAVLFPDLAALAALSQNSPHHIYDAYTHSTETLRNTLPLLHHRLAAIFHDTGKLKTQSTDEAGNDHFYAHEVISEKIAKNALARLCFNSQTKQKALSIIKHHMKKMPTKKTALKHLIIKLGIDTVKDVLAFQRADNLSKSSLATARLQEIAAAQALLQEIIDEGEPLAIKDLVLTGSDVMRILKISPSPEVGKHLEALLQAVAHDPALNTKQSLTDLLLNMHKK